MWKTKDIHGNVLCRVHSDIDVAMLHANKRAPLLLVFTVAGNMRCRHLNVSICPSGFAVVLYIFPTSAENNSVNFYYRWRYFQHLRESQKDSLNKDSGKYAT